MCWECDHRAVATEDDRELVVTGVPLTRATTAPYRMA
jgi:hypothetical protein